MSASGYKQTLEVRATMSAIPPEADIEGAKPNAYVPRRLSEPRSAGIQKISEKFQPRASACALSALAEAEQLVRDWNPKGEE